MLRQNLVYTAVTRGRRLVVIVGQPKALAVAVRGAQARRRWSRLRDWLADAAHLLTCDARDRPARAEQRCEPPALAFDAPRRWACRL